MRGQRAPSRRSSCLLTRAAARRGRAAAARFPARTHTAGLVPTPPFGTPWPRPRPAALRSLPTLSQPCRPCARTLPLPRMQPTHPCMRQPPVPSIPLPACALTPFAWQCTQPAAAGLPGAVLKHGPAGPPPPPGAEHRCAWSAMLRAGPAWALTHTDVPRRPLSVSLHLRRAACAGCASPAPEGAARPARARACLPTHHGGQVATCSACGDRCRGACAVAAALLEPPCALQY